MSTNYNMSALDATHEEGLLNTIDQSSNLTEAKQESDFPLVGLWFRRVLFEEMRRVVSLIFENF